MRPFRDYRNENCHIKWGKKVSPLKRRPKKACNFIERGPKKACNFIKGLLSEVF